MGLTFHRPGYCWNTGGFLEVALHKGFIACQSVVFFKEWRNKFAKRNIYLATILMKIGTRLSYNQKSAFECTIPKFMILVAGSHVQRISSIKRGKKQLGF